MSTIDQCPSTLKGHDHGDSPMPGAVAAAAGASREVSLSSGRAYWRSLDDLAGTSQFKDWVEREFPAWASELLDGTRRNFLKLMGASMGLAGLASLSGCRRPDHRILAYHKDPEHIVPGMPLFYASAVPLPGGGCEGILAETYEGRPTKLEGNPLHPGSQGKVSPQVQASILSLYDPDRDPAVVGSSEHEFGLGAKVASPDDFRAWVKSRFAPSAGSGEGVYFLVEKSTSPSRRVLRDEIIGRKYSRAKWLAYDAIDNENYREASVQVFGTPTRERLNLAKASTILCLDRDLLGAESDGGGDLLSAARGWGQSRFVEGEDPAHRASRTRMCRLYVAESSMTVTGAQADHRVPLRPAQIAGLALAIAEKISSLLGNAAGPLGALDGAIHRARNEAGPLDFPGMQQWVEEVAKDLIGQDDQGHTDGLSMGRGLIVAGPTMSPGLHALVFAMNAALKNIGETVVYRPIASDDDCGMSSSASITELSRAIAEGRVQTLFVIGGNPVFDAPAISEMGGARFADLFGKVPTTVYIGEPNETAAAATMHVCRSHPLEMWGDVESRDGVYTIMQPMIAPLFGTMSDLEALEAIADGSARDGCERVQMTLRTRLGIGTDPAGNLAFESRWRRVLNHGLVDAPVANLGTPAMKADALAALVSGMGPSARPAANLDVVFAPHTFIHDGRNANNGWLMETPHPITKITWDNPALISLGTAQRLGIAFDRHPLTPQYNHARWINVKLSDDRSMTIPVWIQPGLADDVIVLHLGFGRIAGGRVAKGTGFNTFPLRATGSTSLATGGEVLKMGGKPQHLIANTQDHGSMEGRAILREVDLGAWHKHGDTDWRTVADKQQDAYGGTRDLGFAELLGLESHAPANRSVYLQSQSHRYTEVNEDGTPKRDAADPKNRIVGLLNPYGRRVQQWGMSIDMTTCIGCAGCSVACQAENNIPIVGKMEVAKGRELAWIRVDRYYGGGDAKGADPSDCGNPDVAFQPVTCMHCENAPCEVVCPVNATVHDPEGNNNMAYNRCIGTRYCSNNCPYKVRRFNWFDYGTKQYKGGFGQVGEGIPDDLAPGNQNFIPPRLRQPRSEIETMQMNPHVTVRSRGVMEKCTYCIQRVNLARIETRTKDLPYVPDGFFQTACQQACPTGAIVFGDIYDNTSHNGAGSRVQQARNNPRSYGMLGYLNTRPRTTYMLRVRNPNPRLRPPTLDPGPFGHHGHGHEGQDEHHGGESHSHAMRVPGENGRRISLRVLNGAAHANAGALA